MPNAHRDSARATYAARDLLFDFYFELDEDSYTYRLVSENDRVTYEVEAIDEEQPYLDSWRVRILAHGDDPNTTFEPGQVLLEVQHADFATAAVHALGIVVS
jgi:hypothetical protein